MSERVKLKDKPPIYRAINSICTGAFVIGLQSLAGVVITAMWGDAFWCRVFGSVGVVALIAFVGGVVICHGINGQLEADRPTPPTKATTP